MLNIRTASPEKILAIPLDQPEQVFTGDAVVCQKEYRQLAKKWHPDSNPAAPPTVFAHISLLYASAEKKLKAGLWETPGVLRLTDRKGVRYTVEYARRHAFELGSMYISEDMVIYHINEAHADLVGHAQRMIRNFEFADSVMKREHERYLPVLEKAVPVKPKGFMVAIRKRPEMVLLRDLLTYQKGKIDPKHVAWILSSMYNLKCYLHFAGIVHHDISPDTYFVDPKDHSGQLLGGWWYAEREGLKLRALPTRTAKYLASGGKPPRAYHKTDLTLIRATGIDLLGTALLAKAALPKGLAEHLRGIAGSNAFEEYSHWQTKILPTAFGARRYIEMPVTYADIYS